MDGVINLNKPQGLTSRGCVDTVRKLIPGVKIGHAGTLDPAASGVLLLCLGRATSIVEFLMERPKGYRAAVQLGAITDTDDAEGTILREHPVPCLDRTALLSILQELKGAQEQVPPAYSAVKHRGKPLYYWARKGITVPGKRRNVMIYRLDLVQYNPSGQPHLILDIECSRGTYIRTLAAEIGRRIGCGAHLWQLERTFVGCFTVEEASTLEMLESAALQGEIKRYIVPVDRALEHLSSLTLDHASLAHLKHGRDVSVSACSPGADPVVVPGAGVTALPLKIYDSRGRFQALARWVNVEDNIVLKTVRYLATGEGDNRNGTG